MSTTEQITNNIIAEVEKQNVQFESGKTGTKTAERVAEALLGRKLDKIPAASCADGKLTDQLDIENMIFSRNRNNYLYEVNFYQPLEQTKSVFGKLKRLIKRVIRKIMAPVMNPVIQEQNKFNASVTTSINLISDNVKEMIELLERLEEERKAVQALRSEVEQLRKESVEARLEAIRTRKHLHREMELLGEMCSELNHKDTDVYSQIDYEKFENYFRGDEEQIKENQRMYLPYFLGKKNVLDLGCGRGEFLALLRENNVNATGVEYYPPYVKRCRENNLSVAEADAVEYLSGLEAESVDGIFAAQLAEHLTNAQLIKLCKKAYEKLEPGGCLVLETPNPTCLLTYTNSFYLDPSHNKPVHPKALEYYLRDAGFEQVSVVFTESSKPGYRLPLLDMAEAKNLNAFNDGISCLSDLIFGSQDYAIIAIK